MKHCPKCHQDKLETEFFKNKRTKDGLSSWCKVCHTPSALNWQKTNHEKKLKNQKERWWKNREKLLKSARDRNSTPDGKLYVKKYNIITKQRYKRLVIGHYSNGDNKCACCGESIFEFLSIDHINNDGASHRKVCGGGTNAYSWLIKNGFPNNPPLQVLCFNCNQGKRVNGGICPHQLLKAQQPQSPSAVPENQPLYRPEA